MSAVAEQHDVVELLSRPSSHPHRPERVEHHQTPLSHVFVAPPWAYKLKKAVTLSFVDFGTRERRRAVCEDEVRLNRRLCAPVYLGVASVTREADGTLALNGAGDEVEPLVWMRALPASGMLPAALADGRVTAEHLRRFGSELADFHASAPSEPPADADVDPDHLRARWDDVLANCAKAVGSVLPASDRDLLAEFGPAFVERHREAFRGRVSAGRVREGHGDLHSANLCLLESPLPAVDGAQEVPAGLWAFDCIEFSEALRWNDVASEVAFLVMDLDVRGRRDLADAFLQAYEERSGDGDLRRLLPYYTVYRACVRGMVHAQTSRDPELPSEERGRAAERAKEFFGWAARGAWSADGPFVLACAGLSGTGKTTLAARLATRAGLVHLSSDEVRKRGRGADPFARTAGPASADLYSEEARHRVYEAMIEEAERELRAGRSVVVDATFVRAADRRLVADLARRRAIPHVFLECRADPDVVRRRLEARAAGDVPAEHRARSDADVEVYLRQRESAEPFGDDEPVRILDASAEAGDVLEEAVRTLWRWRREAR